MSAATKTKGLAVLAIVLALALGATQLTKGSTTNAAAVGFPGAVPGAVQNGTGAPPAGMPGFGTPVSGATLTRLTQVATAKYPGTVERAMRLQDGSYVVHVIGTSGTETHVLISKAFTVTGTAQGPPPGMGPQGAPPTGRASTS